MTKASTEPVPESVLPDGAVWHGNPALVPFLVPDGSLTEDPSNTNRHPARSIEAIRGSLARFGQQKTIVADRGGVVRAGNGTLRAARELGWTHVAAVRTDLSPVELAAYSLADNRTAQHAEWDYEAVAETLRAIEAEGSPIDDLGWADYELEPLLQATWTPPAVPDGGEPLVPDGAPAGTTTIAVTPAQKAVFDHACAAARRRTGDDRLTAGECLEAVCLEYLGGTTDSGSDAGG